MSVELYPHPSGAQLEYQTFGRGKNYLICFHGFAQDGNSFKFLEDQLEGQYTIIAVRLFYHGSSSRADNVQMYLKIPEWKEIFSDFLSFLKIEQFSILAYSMGGRFAISTFYSFSNQIDHLILGAADGIIRRFWYEFATFPVGLRQLFHYLMINPKPFFAVLHFLSSIKVMNKSVIKFATTQLQKKEQRLLVYQTWVAFKHFRVPQAELIELLNDSTCQSLIIFGKKDRIIDPKAHTAFLSGLTHSEVHVLDHGHNKLLEYADEVIVSALKG
ncbi:alpha/beta fold hydrolase [Reichenbachiella ulvae]|uniref:Alpha/beta hydrolase n=1 Tax=Reichenbachiella ulvae TaxID=2980104 RepID=A0ABT3CPN2_9BACT|nr:alpha/beta hydrolase [Reichenbachiella ulvae]MCV9385617.1 alpha/beta hydrolase [Reichenbachiella ulvae]